MWILSRAFVDYASSRSSPARAAEYWGGGYSAGGQSAPSRSSLIPPAFFVPVKMTGFSRLSRFGLTCEVLTENRGEELLISYRAAFLAKTYQPRAKAQASTARVPDCGASARGSSVRFDLASRTWKTARCSSAEVLQESLVTLPRSGTMRNGWLWARTTSVPRISANVSGSSPWIGTPTVSTTIRSARFRSGRRLPTPCEFVAANPVRPTPDGITFFHTPNCSGLDGGSNSRKALQRRTAQFPTPRASDAKRGDSPCERRRKSPSLESAVRYPTPRTRGMCGGSGSMAQAKKLQAQGIITETERKAITSNGGRLNPTWVEWLMGWPLEWTGLKPLGTDKFRSWLLSHSASFTADFSERRREAA